MPMKMLKWVDEEVDEEVGAESEVSSFLILVYQFGLSLTWELDILQKLLKNDN